MMPKQSGSSSPAPLREREELLLRFDRAWQGGSVPRIEEHLPELFPGGEAQSNGRAVLGELVKIDLEYRWRNAGQRRLVSSEPPAATQRRGWIPDKPCLADYVKRYPELGRLDQLPVPLIVAEYEVRHTFGDRPTHDEYLARFPHYRDDLDKALAKVDTDLAREKVQPSAPPPAPSTVRDQPSTPPPAPSTVGDSKKPTGFGTTAASSAVLVKVLRQHELVSKAQLTELGRDLHGKPTDPRSLAREMVSRGWLTTYQASQWLRGRAADLVAGQYILLEPLGEGGTGKVFKARHQKMNRVVALKLIRPELMADPEVLARFYREIEVISRLSHPNIVHAYDAGPIGATHVLVMEYVEGIDLGKMVRQNGPLPIREACEYIRQACLGLQYAHEKGLIHRDVKPPNLLVTLPSKNRESTAASSESSARARPLVKILDMGLARLQQVELGPDGNAERSVTQLYTPLGSVMMGTPDYMAPEQAVDFHSADIRSDIYSVGCTLYYVLTGKPPFPGGSPFQKLLRHQQMDPPPIESLRPDVPAELAATLNKMLAKQPEERYQTPGEVAEALSVLSGSGVVRVKAAAPEAAFAETVSDHATDIDPGPAEAPGDQPSDPVSGSETPPPQALEPPPARPRAGRRLSRRMALAIGGGLLGLALLGFFLTRGGSEEQPTKPAALVGEPPKKFTNSVQMALVMIPAGSFKMGSPEGEAGRMPREGPVHEVRITRRFYMGVTEVTQGQYQAVMGKNPSFFSPTGPGAAAVVPLDTAHFPVENISWEEAVEFCTKLSDLPAEKAAGHVYRLPTEAEWEYACRAGSQTDYAFGSDPKGLSEHSWHPANAGGRTHPVAQLKANAFGLYDMHGNVAEYVADYLDDDYYAKSPKDDPAQPNKSANHICRGGAWNVDPPLQRSGFRNPAAPGTRYNHVGFRVVCGVPG
jgi:serine/threonine-protein kinase